jgi:hypothetical protein
VTKNEHYYCVAVVADGGYAAASRKKHGVSMAEAAEAAVA